VADRGVQSVQGHRRSFHRDDDDRARLRRHFGADPREGRARAEKAPPVAGALAVETVPAPDRMLSEGIHTECTRTLDA
jgi:hypothetical protein